MGWGKNTAVALGKNGDVIWKNKKYIRTLSALQRIMR